MPRKLEFKIRHGCRPDEIPKLREIERACFEFGVAWNLKQFKENIPTSQVWVCEARHTIVGFLVAWMDRGVPHIGSVDVASDCRGRGIASALIAECDKYYQQLGYERVTLLVHTENPAQTLYFKLGFRALKLYPNCEYGSKRKNMLLMQKAIPKG